MKKRKVKVPIYHSYLTIIETENIKEQAEKYNVRPRGDPTREDYNYDAITFRDFSKNGYLCYYCIFRPQRSYGTIAHEAKHIVNHIFNDLGIELDRVNDEPECYLLGWVVNQIHLTITE